MIKIYLSMSIFDDENHDEISFDIEEEELQTIIEIAERNDLDIAILNSGRI